MDAIPPLNLESFGMTDLLRALARMRQVLEGYEMERQALLAQLKASAHYHCLEDSEKSAQAMVDRLTDEVKARAVAAFDGNKHPVAGVNLQEKTVLTCTDPDAARKYALEIAPVLVKIDWTAFEREARKVAGGPLALPFYRADTVVAATIASDLSVYLVEDTPETIPAETES